MPDRFELRYIDARVREIGYHGLGAPERELLVVLGIALGAGVAPDLDAHAQARLGGFG